MKAYDILVVGNGVLGLSTAFALHLAEPNLNIAIIGLENHSGAASVRDLQLDVRTLCMLLTLLDQF